MKLLAIVLCLLSERFLIHSLSDSRFYWFNTYLQKIAELPFIKAFSANRWALLFLLNLPLLLITSFVFFVFHNWLYGFIGFLLNIAIFYSCLGPENPFFPIIEEGLDAEERISNYFNNINRQLFSPILWFIITGPIGLLVYRLLTLSQNFELVSKEATMATNILEWVPVRITAFLFLLVGNFQQGLVPYKRLFVSDISNNGILLGTCGLEALRSHENDILSVSLAENVVEQALIILLVILAVCTNIAWL